MSSANTSFLIGFVLATCAGAAVFLHADKHRIKHPTAWASFVFLALIVGLPAYFVYVTRLRRRRTL